MKRFLFILTFIAYYTFCIAQTIVNPVFDKTDTPVFHVDKIEIAKDTTYVFCTYSAEAGTWANISPDTYLEDVENGKTYKICRSEGLPFAQQKRSFLYAEKCLAKFAFPHINKTNKLNFVESKHGEGLNVYGISLTSSFNQTYTESEFKRIKNKADFYFSANDTIKSIEFKKKEMDACMYLYGIKSELYAYSLLDLCMIYHKYELNEDALTNMIDFTKLQAEIGGEYNSFYALSLKTLALFYSLTNNVEQAIKIYHQSIELYDSLNCHDEGYAQALYFIASDYEKIGNLEKALYYHTKCLKVRKEFGNPENYLFELRNLVLSGSNKDYSMKKIEIAEKELFTIPTFVDTTSIDFVDIIISIAQTKSLLDDNQKAIYYCDRALSIWDNNIREGDIVIAELLSLKCKYQQRIGLKDDAIASGETAKRLYEALNILSLKYAELLGDLSWAYGLALDYEKSVQLQLSATEIYQNAKDWISLAEAYNSISHYYQSAEKLDNAEQYIKKAIDVLNEHDNAEQYIMDAVVQTGNKMMNDPFALASIKQRIDTDKSNFLQTLARIYQKKGNYADAINTELDNGKILKNMGDLQMYAVHLMALSEYYLRNHQQQDAIACSEQSIQLLSKDNRISLALPKLQLAIISFQAGDTIRAIRYAEESVSASNSFNDNESKVAAQSILSFFYWKNRLLSKAEKCLSEELDFLKKFISNELTGMTTEQKQRLWSKYEHSFLLYRSIIEKSDRNAGLLSKLYDYILFSKSLLLDTEIQQDANNVSRFNVKWNDIQQHLSNDAIAVEFISTMEDEGGYNTYHALVIDRNTSIPRMITLYSESKLEEIKNADTRTIRDIVGELIWKPILAQYPTVKDIYFSPDGILHILPIEYYSADGMSSMFEQYHMYRLSSTKELVREQGNNHPNSAVLYGGLDYNLVDENSSVANSSEIPSVWRGIAERGGFDPLFNTSIETQEIKDLLAGKNISTTLYSGGTGTEESFRNLSGRSNSIIHLATHGMYINPDGVDTKKNENNFDFLESLANVNDPVKEDVVLTHSFLVMAGGNRVISRVPVSDKNNDGILTSKEISQLDLRGLDLVVLSACESALGDINNGGVYGLQRGFKKAGAHTILMSLNKVDDESTKILMVEFYRNLMNGKSKYQSLKEAQKHLRQVDNGKYDDPKYWASFIMLDGLN